jgi:hypothetical protein
LLLNMPIQNKAPTPKRQAEKHSNSFAPTENNSMAKQITDARQAPFVWFDVKLDDAELSPYAFRLYCRIARRTGGGKTQFFEALTHAASACKMSERQARYAIKDLLQARMIRCVQKQPGYPTIYALTDKSEWVLPLPAAPLQEVQPLLHYMPPSPASNAGPPAPDAALPLHQMPPKKNHGRRTQKKTTEEEAVRARAKNATAAASRYSELEILDYLDDVKPQNKPRNIGLAHKLYLTGEDDHLVQRWLQQKRQQEQTLAIQQQQAAELQLQQALDLAWLMIGSKRPPDAREREWIADLITTLTPEAGHAHVVAQLKGLL